MKEKEKIFFFVPYQIHLKHLYGGLFGYKNIGIFAFSRKSLSAKQYHYEKVTPVHKTFFPPNLNSLSHKLRIVEKLPIIVFGFSKVLAKNEFVTVICFDFYHWYTLQAIRYKKKHPRVKLIIYSETKRWPKNWSSRLVMRGFLAYVRRNLRHVDGVLVYTEEGKAWWAEAAPAARVAVLPAPVDVERFQPATNKEWLPNDTLRILMNARYSPYKRHEDLLAAVAALREQGRAVAVTLIGRDDGGRGRVEALVAEAGLQDIVTFLDPLPMSEMPALYHRHDVLVLPSYNEAIGMVVPEAMACGLPTITSDTVGANVYVKKGETGFVYETGNVPALTTALTRCFDVTLLAQFGQNGREHIAVHFTPQQIAQQFLDFLELS